MDGVTGPDATSVLVAYIIREIIIMMVALGCLGYLLPRFNMKTDNDTASHTVLAYVAIYVWAFSFVDFLWWLLPTYYSSVMGYWVLMGLCLVIAAIFASMNGGNFYGSGGNWNQCFGNMLCWTIDFGVWWGWCQVMTDIDTWVAPQGEKSVQVVLANLGITLVLLIMAALIYVFADHGDMIASQAARANPVPTEVFKFGDRTKHDRLTSSEE